MQSCSNVVLQQNNSAFHVQVENDNRGSDPVRKDGHHTLKSADNTEIAHAWTLL